ncbi:hypothetical protein BDN67DRAFT_964619 [Paxillus ammoniavirescens]|nr:hypothetical protein BDN67DRAFT_964619 [Paxillus ammoniavirescens]
MCMAEGCNNPQKWTERGARVPSGVPLTYGLGRGGSPGRERCGAGSTTMLASRISPEGVSARVRDFVGAGLRISVNDWTWTHV